MSGRILALALALMLPGCSFLTVTKVDPDALSGKGVRFALPRPYLMVTPNGGGGVDVSAVYLPDPNATFAASAEAWFATHRLDLEIEAGLLTIATWNTDTSAVMAQGVETGSTFAEGVLEAQVKAEESAAAGAAAAQKKLADAEAAVRVAQAVFDAHPTPENRAKLAGALAAAQNASLALGVLGNQLRDPGDPKGAWGPMFYAIEDTLDRASGEHTVALRATEAFPEAPHNQMRFETSRPPTIDPTPHFFPSGLISPRALRRGGRPRFEIAASAPFEIEHGKTLLLYRDQEVPVDQRLALSQPSPMRALVVVLPGAPPGRYRLVLTVMVGKEIHSPEFEFQL